MRLSSVLVLYLVLSFIEGKRRGSTHLNVFIEAKEVSRFLYDINTALYLVRNSKVAPMIRKPISKLIPPISPSIKDLRFKFNTSGRVRYLLSFRSSNTTVMDHPRASIPVTGFVPRKTKGFRVSFPCTGKKSGVVLLLINLSFSDKAGRKMLWGPLSMSLRRRCKARPNPNSSSQSTSATIQVVPSTCNKRCSKNYIMRRFCLSDYVIRAKIDSEVRKNGRPQLRVRVAKKYKKGAVKITRRQLLELRGQELTCDCSPVVAKRHYLILGKEDKKKRVLYVDNLLIALDWETSGKKMLRMHRKRRYRCPKRIAATMHLEAES